MTETPPKGLPFSRLYVPKGDAQLDSSRARKRIAYYVTQKLKSWDSEIASWLRRELGCNLTRSNIYAVEEFLNKCPINDFLDSITHIHMAVYVKSREGYRAGVDRELKSFVNFANRVFDEERCSYKIDELGGVHYAADQEFYRNRLSTLSVLDEPGMVSTRDAFERAFEAMNTAPPDTLTACRKIFEAVEIAVKALLPDRRITLLGATEVERFVRPAVLETFEIDAQARENASQVVNSLKAWVNGLHGYRHGQNTPEPQRPPLTLTLNLVSAGAAHLRFLVEVLGRQP